MLLVVTRRAHFRDIHWFCDWFWGKITIQRRKPNNERTPVLWIDNQSLWLDVFPVCLTWENEILKMLNIKTPVTLHYSLKTTTVTKRRLVIHLCRSQYFWACFGFCTMNSLTWDSCKHICRASNSRQTQLVTSWWTNSSGVLSSWSTSFKMTYICQEAGKMINCNERFLCCHKHVEYFTEMIY